MCQARLFRRSFVAVAMLVLGLAQPALAADKSWNKIRYQGGTIEARVNPFDWNTTLKLSGNSIEIVFAGSKTIRIHAGDVVALTYGEKAYHRVAAMLDLSPASRPVPLFGIIHDGKEHLVGIEFLNADDSRGALLLLVHKDSYRPILDAISTLTGKPAEGTP